jgi:Carbohydrate family 9 binding domain-like
VTRAHVVLLAIVIGLGGLLFLGMESIQSDVVQPAEVLDPAPRGYVCYRASVPPIIDGKLDDSVWQAVPWSEPFSDIEGDLKPEPPLRTRMKMLWDDQCLYIAAELEEPHVWATLRDHDAVIFHDNDFEVFIDPDADGHLYGELELNAFNTTWDLLLSKAYKDAGNAVNAWEITGLKTAVHVDGTINNPADRDRGWTVEMAWPWTSLREISSKRLDIPVHGEQWRINFSRVEWDIDIVGGKYVKVPNRPEHNWVWSPQGAIDMHRPDRWGILQFSTDPPGTTAFVPDPAQPARDYLHRVYYAERAHYKGHGRYVERLSDLGLANPGNNLFDPRLETKAKSFDVSVELRLPDGRRERWRINEEARIRTD